MSLLKSSISCNEAKTYAKTVRHVIEEHGCRDIFHVAGDDKHYFTYRRIEAYKNVLEKHGIPFSDDKVYFGNLWMSCGEEAVNYILESYKDKDKKEMEVEISTFAKENTAMYKIPRIYEFVDELPKTISGKIRRVEIREKDKGKDIEKIKQDF